MKPLITICARGGSKGVPGKNTNRFNGKPLISWTIERALDWGAGPVIVSSDDEKVYEIFQDCSHTNIYYDERPARLAQDDTPKLEALRNILHKWGAAGRHGELPSYIVDLDVTNPCRTVGDLDICRAIFAGNELKTLFSVTEAKKNPYFNQALIYGGKWTTPSLLPRTVTYRQDAPLVWDINSNIYFYDTKWLLGDITNSPISNNHGIYEMPDHAFCDIDNQVDFEVAEFLHKKYYL